MKLISQVVAVSSGAMLPMRRSSESPARGTARVSEVEAQRAEWRIPDDAGAGRHADRGIVDELHAALTEKRLRGANNGSGTGRNEAVDFAGGGDLGLALVAPHRAGIDEHRAAESGILGQEIEWILHLEAGAPVIGAADRVVRGSRRDVARADAGR